MQGSMNVLFISATYPTPRRPRQGAFNAALVSALQTHHDVRVIAPVPWTQAIGGKATASRREHVGESRSSAEYPLSLYPPKLFRSSYGSFLWHSIRQSVRRLGKEFRPDVVFGYWLHPDGEAANRAARYFDVPSVVMAGGSDLRQLPATAARRRAVGRVLRQADRVIVVSEELRKRAISFGLNGDRVELIRRGVNRDLFYPVDRRLARAALGLPDDAVVLLWAGRLEPVKNPAMLLYAAREWQRRWGNRLRVLMFGDGSMQREISELRRDLQLEQVVQLHPAISQTELALRYKAADLTILTSHSEGVPNVLMESITCGVPFVATKVGGVEEIATPGLDALVGDGNIQQLIEAVIQRVECRGANNQHQRQFVPPRIEQMADQFDNLIGRVTETHRRELLPLPLHPVPTEASSWTEAAG